MAESGRLRELVRGEPTTTTTRGLIGEFEGAEIDAAGLDYLEGLEGRDLSLGGVDGFIGGVQAGYNHQIGQLVLGVEADFSGSGLSDAQTFGGVLDARFEIDWFGTVRGRAGYSFDRLLVYGTGGFAYARGELEYELAGIELSQSETMTGYTLGAGLEYGFSERLTGKLEYKYLDFGDETFLRGTALETKVGFDAHTLVAGVNLRF